MLPGLTGWGGHALAAAMGAGPIYCAVAGWWPVGADLAVTVECYDIVTSAPAEAPPETGLVTAGYTA